MKNKKVFFTTKWITYTALLTAFVVATATIPGVQILSGKIYWCDFAIFTAAYLVDPLSATIVGGIGTAFFDLFGINGTAYNAIPSLLIHGLQGCTAALIFTFMKRLNKSGSNAKEGVIAVLSSILPALIVIAGYFLKRLYWEHLDMTTTLLKIPANVLQELVGITVAVVICYACRFKQRLIHAHLLPDFRQEVLDKRKVKDGV